MDCIYCHREVDVFEPGFGWAEDEAIFFHLECAQLYADIKVA